jgi:hypothetical protein
MAFKKKLYRYRPNREGLEIETQRTTTTRRPQPADARSLERGVRQLLADKVSGSMVGLWLLAPEHLRLGTFDLLCGWTGQPPSEVEPRLALQVVHEAALCVTGVRATRCLTQRGFELANGLPFAASDPAIHDLLAAHTVAEAESLQATLGRLRRASGHFSGRLLAIDPHRIRSWTQRAMRLHRTKEGTPAVKAAQTFFALDTETSQPLCFTSATAARTVGRATPGLLRLAADILRPDPGQTLVLADCEHFAAELVDGIRRDTPFDFLVPAPARRSIQARMRAVPDEAFIRHWAGYATAQIPYEFGQGQTGPFHLFVQRGGERPEDYTYHGFLSTTDRDPVEALTGDFPKRWHVEEFFNLDQDIGWARAGTQNLHIRYGHMTLALIAQAAIHQLRRRLGPPAAAWNAEHLAHSVFQGIEGDLRVADDTLLVTFYNAPQPDLLRPHYEHLPEILQAEHVDPRIPWLYGLKLDFRFR